MAVLESSWVLDKFKLCKQELRAKALFKLNIYIKKEVKHDGILIVIKQVTLHPHPFLRLMGYLTSPEIADKYFQPRQPKKKR